MSQTTEIQDEAPEGYKRVQLGPRTLPVPTDWEIKRVDEITENLDRKREPIKSSKRKSGDIPYYGATGQVDSVSGYLFDEELVLVGEDGADWSPFGGTSYIISGKSWVNNHVHVLRCANIVEEFLSNYLDYIEMRQVISGTNRGKLNQSELNQFPVLYPSLPEQRHIADILSTVEEQIQQTDEIIEKIKSLKRGLMQSFFSGTDSNNTREVRFGSNLATIPADWEVTTLSQVCEKIVDGPHTTPDYTDTGIPFVSAGDIENGEIDFENCKRISEEDDSELRPRVDPQEGDILLGKVGSGSLGKVCIVDTSRRFNIFVQLALLRPITGKITPGYLGTTLQYRQMQQQVLDNASGASMQYIGTGAIGDLEIPLPTIEEQEEISKGFGYIRQKIRQERKHKSELQELKRGLMQDLLTGKVRVSTD